MIRVIPIDRMTPRMLRNALFIPRCRVAKQMHVTDDTLRIYEADRLHVGDEVRRKLDGYYARLRVRVAKMQAPMRRSSKIVARMMPKPEPLQGAGGKWRGIPYKPNPGHPNQPKATNGRYVSQAPKRARGQRMPAANQRWCMKCQAWTDHDRKAHR